MIERKDLNQGESKESTSFPVKKKKEVHFCRRMAKDKTFKAA
jgi:hypothetical protein